MENSKIHVGMIVRYNAKWCRPEEANDHLLVRENRMNPVTHEMTRWVVQNLDVTILDSYPVEDVDNFMIEPYEGFEDYNGIKEE